MLKLPVVVIVGRQNTGKSSLLNAMVGRRLSIVDPMPGVTRDRVSCIVAHKGTAFELVDTGGIGLVKNDPYFEDVEQQIEQAIADALVVVFLVDAQSGVVPLDRKIAARFRDKKVVLAANKADNTRLERSLNDFFELGFGEAFPVSAVHRRNIRDLMDRVAALLPPVPIPDRGLHVAVIGKRNVGKSTLVNALAGEERVIVSEMPGTTRDAVDVVFEKDGRRYVLVDTAGIRKKQKFENSVEFFSRVRTDEAIERADVVAFMIDVMEKVTDVDKRIARLIEDKKKPCVIVLNKYDLVSPKNTPDEFLNYLTKVMPILRYAPVSMISAKGRVRIWEFLEICAELHVQSCVKISTPEVNRVLDRVVKMRSPSGRGPRSARIYYATQKSAQPPRFIVFVNDPRSFAPNYVRYLEDKMRELLPFHEVPIRLELRARQRSR